MAGTGLPIPKSQGVLAQVSAASAISSAPEWTKIAAAGAEIAKTGGDMLQKEQHLQQAGAVADFELRHRDEFVKANDRFYGDPQGFESWARAHSEGVMANVPGWMVPHATSVLGRMTESGIGTQLNVKRQRDDTLARDQVTYRIKTADDDLMSLSSRGEFASETGVAAVQTYKGLLDTAVSSGMISQARADFMLDDAALRAQGNQVRVGLEGVYQREGYEAAKNWLHGTAREIGAKYKFSDKIERDGMAWLRSQESGLRGERDAVGREWQAARPQIETMTREQIADMRDRAFAVGNMRVGQDIDATFKATEIVKQLRTLPPSELAAVAGAARLAAAPLESKLAGRESSNNPGKVNQLGYAGLYQFGAPRLADLGIYTPGSGEDLRTWSKTPRDAAGKWSGTFNIPGFPDVKTLDDFRGNEKAQQAAFALHRQKMDSEIKALGLDRFEGQNVGGAVIDRSALYGMIHLAGAGGTKQVLESGGSYNPPDANGTRALDYAKAFGGVPADGEGAGIDLTQSRQGLLALGMLKREMAKDVAARITDLQTRVARSEFPPIEDIRAVGQLVAAVGTPEQRRKVAEFTAQAESGRAFLTLSPAQRTEIVSRAEAAINAGASQFDRHLGAALRKADQDITAAYGKDPYGAAYRFGQGYQALPAIDFGSPTLGDQLAAKVTQQNQIRADQDMGAFSVLRPAEAQSLAGVLVSGQPQTARAMLAQLTALPRDVYLATLADGPVKSALDGMIRSYDPERLDAAFAALDRAWRQDPQGFKGEFGDETMRRLQTWQALRDQKTPAGVAAHFQRADDPAMRDARKRLGEEADEKVKTLKAADIAEALGSSWGVTPGFVARNLTGSDPSAPADAIQGAVLVEEFGQLFRERYVDTGDADMAKSQAVERLKQVWGPSALTGGALIKHPPDRYYPEVDGSHDWMKADVEKAIEGITGKPRLKAPDMARMYVEEPNWSYKVVSDAQTAAEVAARRPPSYMVVVTDAATGRSDPPLGPDGRPQRFRFDPGPAQETARGSFGTRRQRLIDNQAADSMFVGGS